MKLLRYGIYEHMIELGDYLRTNMLLIRVAGKQNTITRMSATAKFTMK